MHSVARGGGRPLDTFNIPPSILSKLVSAGFQRASDLSDLQPSDIASEAGITVQEALSILNQVNEKPAKVLGAKRTALELLATEDAPGILTFVREIDEMLGMGVAMGKITEFCGAPGLGKTQLGIQLAVDVHLPPSLDGPFGHCIYIDTEGSFMPQRVAEIAKGFVDKVQSLYEVHKDGMDAAERQRVESITVESILNSIYYFRVHNYVEQIALVHVLRERIQNELKQVKLIVIDSIAFHFRRNFEDYAMRTRLLGNMSQTLIELAKDFNLAVVLMNQVTTKFGQGKVAELVPALGETWGHSSTNRIMLYEKNGTRFARLLKSPNRKKAEVPFQITEQGVRSVDYIPDVPNHEGEEEQEEQGEDHDHHHHDHQHHHHHHHHHHDEDD